jgi:hypothetical protein
MSYFVHKKSVSKRKVCIILIKNYKFKKKPKKAKKNIFSGFFRWFFWVFWVVFFIANPDQVEVRDLTAAAQLSHVLHTVDLVVEMHYSPVGEL